MESHSKTYEQFCWVKGRNIVMEETVFHDGNKKVICVNLHECDNQGGCKNKSLQRLWCCEKTECSGECEELTNGQ